MNTEIVRIFLLVVVPLFGAAMLAAIISGIIQGVTKIHEPAVSYIIRVLACIVCLYITIPSIVNIFELFAQDVLSGKY